MSVIVRNLADNLIYCFSKGADSSIAPLLVDQNSKFVNDTLKEMDNFAAVGLRTLVFAKR